MRQNCLQNLSTAVISRQGWGMSITELWNVTCTKYFIKNSLPEKAGGQFSTWLDLSAKFETFDHSPHTIAHSWSINPPIQETISHWQFFWAAVYLMHLAIMGNALDCMPLIYQSTHSHRNEIYLSRLPTKFVWFAKCICDICQLWPFSALDCAWPVN